MPASPPSLRVLKLTTTAEHGLDMVIRLGLAGVSNSVESRAGTAFERDPHVRDWVLKEARGICELCEQKAPFVGIDDTPYLEVHHVRTLAEGGPDTPENTVALCPNCHRELHYSLEREVRIGIFYARVQRLRRQT